VSVDAATGLPLAVRVEARGASAPALEVAFTSISFDEPPASTFAFVPPPGITASEVASPADLLPVGFGIGDRARRGGDDDGKDVGAAPIERAAGSASTVRTVGEAWDTVKVISGTNARAALGPLLENAPQVQLPNGSSARLITTKLVNVLVLSDGRIVVGAVTPAALETAAAE
jgi:hypothetical protein